MELHLHSPNTPSWRGAQLKEAQGQLYFTLLYFTLLYPQSILLGNAHAHVATSIQDLAWCQFETLGHPSYYLDMISCDFNHFAKMK
jgi:hypothetical protein